MNVKLAVQLFSESVATSMEFYSTRQECTKLHDCEGTVSFTRMLNTLYDCLNIQRAEDVAKAGPGQLNVIKESITWLEDWCNYRKTLNEQQQACFLSRQTCAALRITLKSTVDLVESLRACGYKYVLTGKLGQDPLEVKTVFCATGHDQNLMLKAGKAQLTLKYIYIYITLKFFGIMRHVTGDGGRTTAVQFLYIYRMLSVNNIVKPPQRMNVQAQGPQLLLTLQSLFDQKLPSSNHVRETTALELQELIVQHRMPSTTFHADMTLVVEYVSALVEQLDNVLLDPECARDADQEAESGTKDAILKYLGGYLVHKFRGGDCVPCLASLESQEQETARDLIALKTHGDLKRPSPGLMKLLKLAELHVEESTQGHVKFSMYADIIEAVLMDDDLPSAAVG
ncbi:uncharacterized protein LOC135383104 [Ornithodoros turicata]|uniref:uncharacterized protein LOC135383104 n=1 Tax=Ornithodoros turicata TaxID=34597 RepID=UPI00313A1CB9